MSAPERTAAALCRIRRAFPAADLGSSYQHCGRLHLEVHRYGVTGLLPADVVSGGTAEELAGALDAYAASIGTALGRAA